MAEIDNLFKIGVITSSIYSNQPNNHRVVIVQYFSPHSRELQVSVCRYVCGQWYDSASGKNITPYLTNDAIWMESILTEYCCEKCGCVTVPMDSLKTGKMRECIRHLNEPEKCTGTDLYTADLGDLVLERIKRQNKG